MEKENETLTEKYNKLLLDYNGLKNQYEIEKIKYNEEKMRNPLKIEKKRNRGLGVEKERVRFKRYKKNELEEIAKRFQIDLYNEKKLKKSKDEICVELEQKSKSMNEAERSIFNNVCKAIVDAYYLK